MTAAADGGARAVVVRRAGGYDRLRLEPVPLRAPGPGDVRVAVRSAGVNYADVLVRMGLYATARDEVGWPITPGFEVAGRVDAAGEGVDDLAPGDPVVAVTFFGAYASHVVVPRAQVFRRPTRLDEVAAGGLIVGALTAYYALFELVAPRPGRTLLVHSAAGGVGNQLVQMGRRAGCRVIGVVGSAAKVPLVASLGAETVIDKSSTDLWRAVDAAAPGGLDAVFDANGVETLRGGYDRLAPGGRLVVYGAHSMFRRGRERPSWPKLAWDYLRTPRVHPLDLAGTNKGVLGFNLSRMFAQRELLDEAMARILAWVDDGSLRIPEVTRFPLERAADAHRALQSGETRGKLVLEVEASGPHLA